MENLVKNEAYTHYSDVEGNNVTFCKEPNNQFGVVVRTKLTRGKVMGTTVEVQKQLHFVLVGPLTSYVYGTSSEVKSFFTPERRAEKMLPSWVDRVINDHIKHFYTSVP